MAGVGGVFGIAIGRDSRMQYENLAQVRNCVARNCVARYCVLSLRCDRSIPSRLRGGALAGPFILRNEITPVVEENSLHVHAKLPELPPAIYIPSYTLVDVPQPSPAIRPCPDILSHGDAHRATFLVNRGRGILVATRASMPCVSTRGCL